MDTKANNTTVNDLSDKVDGIEENLNELITYSETDGKPTITINLP